VVETSLTVNQSTNFPTASLPLMKIVGFTDRNFVPIAKRWYYRLLEVGCAPDDIVIVCLDPTAVDELNRENITSVEEDFIESPERKRFVLGFFRQLMMKRLQFAIKKMRAGVSILLTDIDNIFMRHVPLSEFWDESYDVIHAYEGRFPVPVFEKMGFVVCGGRQWFRATKGSILFLEMVMKYCQNEQKCNDQIAFNQLMLNDLQMQWDKDLYRSDAPRVNLPANEEMHGLMTESVTGRSLVTNHTVKIWSRDFATRWMGDPEYCPSSNNWVAMPTKMQSTAKLGKVESKLKSFDAWIGFCGTDGTKRRTNST
jgi:hypothetical protein